MNLERADPSYTAWDQRIVAKSQRNSTQASGERSTTPALNRDNVEAPGKGYKSERTFGTALEFAAAHERALDPTWRSVAAETGSEPASHNGDNQEFGFWDFIDVINPLQHIPIVSTLYRELTGDEISAPARIMGGALFGGPLGFAASLGNAILEEAAGQDAGEIALAMVLDDEALADETAIAQNAGTADDHDQSAMPEVADGTGLNLPGAPGGSQHQQTASSTAPRQVENAGSAAVSEMLADNVALQNLLKDMGLSGAVTTTAGPMLAQRPDSAPTSTQAGESPPSAWPTSATSIVTAAAASASAAPAGNLSETKSLNARADAQNIALEPRKAFPIDTSRYITSHGTANASRASQTATLNNAARESTHTQASSVADSATSPVNAGNSSGETTPLQASFADRMLQALDRYQTLNKADKQLPGAITNDSLPSIPHGAI
jgi:hypothetical protein